MKRLAGAREAMLVVADEADDVAERWIGQPIRRRWDDPHRGLPVHVRHQLVAILEFVQRKLRHH
jgi:hypothetical protein